MDNATEEMIKRLMGAEEVLAVLDQHAGGPDTLPRCFATMYKKVETLRDEEVLAWNGDLNPGEEKIFRCDRASEHYHTNFDGPCSVWTTSAGVCELHQQTDIDNERRKAEIAGGF